MPPKIPNVAPLGQGSLPPPNMGIPPPGVPPPNVPPPSMPPNMPPQVLFEAFKYGVVKQANLADSAKYVTSSAITATATRCSHAQRPPTHVYSKVVDAFESVNQPNSSGAPPPIPSNATSNPAQSSQPPQMPPMPFPGFPGFPSFPGMPPGMPGMPPGMPGMPPGMPPGESCEKCAGTNHFSQVGRLCSARRQQCRQIARIDADDQGQDHEIDVTTVVAQEYVVFSLLKITNTHHQSRDRRSRSRDRRSRSRERYRSDRRDRGRGRGSKSASKDRDASRDRSEKTKVSQVTSHNCNWSILSLRQDPSRAMIHAHQSENNGSNGQFFALITRKLQTKPTLEVALGTDAHRMMINAWRRRRNARSRVIPSAAKARRIRWVKLEA